MNRLIYIYLIYNYLFTHFFRINIWLISKMKAKISNRYRNIRILISLRYQMVYDSV